MQKQLQKCETEIATSGVSRKDYMGWWYGFMKRPWRRIYKGEICDKGVK